MLGQLIHNFALTSIE